MAEAAGAPMAKETMSARSDRMSAMLRSIGDPGIPAARAAKARVGSSGGNGRSTERGNAMELDWCLRGCYLVYQIV